MYMFRRMAITCRRHGITELDQQLNRPAI